MEIEDIENIIEDELRMKRNRIVDALSSDPSEDNPYFRENIREMARLRLGREYVKITEALMRRSD